MRLILIYRKIYRHRGILWTYRGTTGTPGKLRKKIGGAVTVTKKLPVPTLPQSNQTLGTKPTNGPLLSADDRQAIKLLNSSIRHLGDRYEVGIIWKDRASPLPDNRQLALRRFLMLETRLRKDPAYAEEYAKVMDEYIALDHASDVCWRKQIRIDDTGIIPISEIGSFFCQ